MGPITSPTPPGPGADLSPLDQLIDTFESTVGECLETMRKKNHDYTSGSADVLANFRAAEVVGVGTGQGILLRVLDKMKRLQTFLERGTLQVDGESVDDAMMDVINYMILLRHYVKGERGDF